MIHRISFPNYNFKDNSCNIVSSTRCTIFLAQFILVISADRTGYVGAAVWLEEDLVVGCGLEREVVDNLVLVRPQTPVNTKYV